MEHEPRPDPGASHQSAVAAESGTVYQAGGNLTVVVVRLSAVVVLVAAAVVGLVASQTGEPSAPRTSAGSPPSGRVPLFDLTPDSTPVLNDETDTVDQQKDARIKVARHFCSTGVPAVVAETYDLGGSYTTFTARVSVDDEPSGTPVTFSVVVDGVRVATRTVPVARTEDLDADVAGKRTMTLETTTAVCEDVKAAWVWPTLVTR
ncbi:NPCBM/NEW2 domain-containing protein [Umezawaea sp. NPDC059074]|uniref:NPCBM/NEW2 domain-containing protein n=1 Tax=Umezawaea sp. NPDC059074 TaxID=3346716 RepID=UPI00369A6ACF